MHVLFALVLERNKYDDTEDFHEYFRPNLKIGRPKLQRSEKKVNKFLMFQIVFIPYNFTFCLFHRFCYVAMQL